MLERSNRTQASVSARRNRALYHRPWQVMVSSPPRACLPLWPWHVMVSSPPRACLPWQVMLSSPPRACLPLWPWQATYVYSIPCFSDFPALRLSASMPILAHLQLIISWLELYGNGHQSQEQFERSSMSGHWNPYHDDTDFDQLMDYDPPT